MIPTGKQLESLPPIREVDAQLMETDGRISCTRDHGVRDSILIQRSSWYPEVSSPEVVYFVDSPELSQTHLQTNHQMEKSAIQCKAQLEGGKDPGMDDQCRVCGLLNFIFPFFLRLIKTVNHF